LTEDECRGENQGAQTDQIKAFAALVAFLLFFWKEDLAYGAYILDVRNCILLI